MRTSSIVRETGRRVRATFAGAVLCALGVACHAVPPGEPTPSVDQGAVTTPVDPLPRDWEPFDTRFLHRIEILVAPEHLEALERDRDTRVPCDITLNGITLRQAGIRQKGGGGSIRPLHDKPSFSLRFDEFVEDQSYRGLDRLLLNNSVQDPSLLNEHLAYELHRRAGLPAPRTAHAMVTLNGRFLGFYVVREAFEKRFLRRVFHSSTGNLYEGNCCTDFAPPFGNPSMLDLKNEEEEQRTREDLERFAHLLVYTPDAQLEDALDEVLDVDRFLTYYALEAALAHWDGFSFNLNNYYLYDDPLDGRFVFLPHGMDQLLDRPTMDPWMMPKSLLTGRIRRHPRLDLRFREHLIDVVARVWNEGDLLFRADEVRRIVRSAPHVDPAVPRAIDAFDPAFQTQRARYRARLDLLRDRVTR